MGFARKLPFWAWWIIGVGLVATIVAVAALVRPGQPRVPPGLVEKREAVVRLLDESKQLEDVDVQPLTEFEAKKDYPSASALMAQALEVNARHEVLNASLLTLARELARLALEVEPDEIGAKAVEAFGALAKLAQAERDFYASRRQAYEISRSYYAELAAKRSPPVPPGLALLVDATNANFERAKRLEREFASAVKAFDQAVARR